MWDKPALLECSFSIFRPAHYNILMRSNQNWCRVIYIKPSDFAELFWISPLTTTRSVWCACTISSEWSKKKLWKQCLRCTHSVDKQMILLQIMASASLFFSQCERSEHGVWGGAPTAGKGSDMGHCLFSSMCAIRRHECLQKHLYYGWQANNSKKISTAGDTVHIPYFAIIYLASFLKMVSHDVLDS